MHEISQQYYNQFPAAQVSMASDRKMTANNESEITRKKSHSIHARRLRKTTTNIS
jgi:hypothetical protein